MSSVPVGSIRTAKPSRAAVASGHPAVTDAASEILRAGGNAFDAVIAAGFASAVAEATLTSLGGGGFLLAVPAGQRPVLFDFFTDTPGRGLDSSALEPHFLPVTVRFPGSDQVFNIGLGSVAVPGTLRGYLHAHRRLGRMPLGEVVAPAVALARDGVVITAVQAYLFALLTPIVTSTANASAIYAPRGRPIAAGERLVNADFAEYLNTITREGDRDFYEGETARRIALAMREGDGLVTLEDLASYRVEERRPFEGVYRGWRLWTNPPPSFGGSLLALSLRLLEAAGPRLARFGAAEHVARLVATMREVDRRRAAGFCDNPELDDDALRDSVGRIRTATGGTTHVSIVDREGNAASMTTSNGEGSGFIAPGTGIMLNNMMGEDDLHPEGFHSSPAGLRVASMMSPSVLVDDRGEALVLGSGGSKRIRTALLQVLVNRIDIGMPLEEAVDAPRLHWDGEQLQMEPGFGPEAMLGTTGVLSNVWSVRDIYFGGVHAVSTGNEAAADARRGGAARVMD